MILLRHSQIDTKPKNDSEVNAPYRLYVHVMATTSVGQDDGE
ncbi:MAG: hypothetical protein OXG25_01000 [Gammaproteobacteria bacterium]|nr:hypothetical protein [Gammaproteobacteria bacterium]